MEVADGLLAGYVAMEICPAHPKKNHVKELRRVKNSPVVFRVDMGHPNSLETRNRVRSEL